MLTLLFTTNLIMTMTFIMMNHPLSMGLILLIQTTIISLITGNFVQNFWFSYILFLILIGGMLILFMYMTSIASNEKFKLNMKILWLTLTIIPISLIIMSHTNNSIMNNETLLFNKSMTLNISLMKYINTPLMSTLMFLMIYLLLALIATVKITNFKQGSIRQMN